MKKLLLFALAAFFGGSVMAQLNQVYVETVIVHDGTITPVELDGYTTYRIWAELADETDYVSSVFAIAGCHPLDVSTTTSFFNDAAFGAILASGINPLLFGVFPASEFDSWATIGAADNTVPDNGAIGNIWTDPVNALNGPFGDALGASVVANDGAWYTTGATGFPAGGNDVLLAQVTTDGELTFHINVQVFDEGDGVNGRIDYVSSGNVGCSAPAFEQDGSNLGLIFPAPITGPANDDCANAEAISCGSVTAGTTIDATADAEADAIGFCGTTPGAPGVWYVLSGSNAGDVITASTCNDADFDTKINVYNGGCGTLACVDGNDDGSGCTGFTSEISWTSDGGDYYILVNGFGGATGNFNLTVSCDPAGCTDPGACNFDPAAVVDNGSCDYSCIGCMTVGACNYDAAATIDSGDCCFDNCFTLSVGGGSFDSEIGWSLVDDVTTTVLYSGGAGDFDLCLVDGCYTFEMTDAFGDGWNGGIYTISDVNGVVQSGDIDTAANGDGSTTGSDPFTVGGVVCGVFGCTDMAACNYDPAATDDDGSCCSENCATLDMTDSFGDGWNGGIYTITDAITLAVVASGDLDGAQSGNGSDTGSDDLCIPTGCYILEVGGGSFDSEIGITLIGADGGDISGGAGTYTFGIGGASCVFGCTDPTACNYDVAANIDDGSCVSAPCINDIQSLAYALPENALGSCSGYTGEDLNAATVSDAAGGSYNDTDFDLWYSFVPSTSGARIEVTNTNDFDAVVQLYDNAGNALSGFGDIEDITLTNDDEILNIGNLTAGDTYLVRVSPWNATSVPSFFDICYQSIPDTRCDYGPGPYDLCDVFLADWVGSDNYNFVMTADLDGDVLTYNSNGYGTFAPQLKDFSPQPVYGESYSVQINSVFDLTDGNGIMESIEVQGDEPCALNMEPQALQEVRAQDICANNGPHYLGAYISVTPYVCAASDYTWEFTRTDVTELPFEHLRGAANTFLQLSSVPGLQPGGVYDVRVKPEFSNGQATSYGAVQCVSIIGPAGLPAEIETPVVVVADADRSDIESGIEAALYPNPNTGEFVNLNVTNIADGTEKILVDIFDMYGKRVQSEQLAATGSTLNTILKFNGIASGVYTVKININGVVQTERLVIEK